MAMVEDWSSQWVVQFSVKKCDCFLFQEQNTPVARQFKVRLYGECLPHVTKILYLGVWFDTHQTWHRQILEVTTRARDRLWLLRRLGGRDWGLVPYLFLQPVRGAVLPMLYYGDQCWASVLYSSTRLIALDAVIPIATRMAFRLEQTTSVEAFTSGGWLGASKTVSYEISCSVLGAESWGCFERSASYTGCWLTSDPLGIRGYMVLAFRAGEVFWLTYPFPSVVGLYMRALIEPLRPNGVGGWQRLRRGPLWVRSCQWWDRHGCLGTLVEGTNSTYWR